MIKSLVFLIIRNITRNPRTAIINILGLTVSLTCCLIIFNKIKYELSFDRYHTHAESTYRIIRQTQGLGLNLSEGEWEYRIGVYGGLPSAIRNEIPELKHVIPILYFKGLLTNIIDGSSTTPGSIFRIDDAVAYTEPSFFEVFDYQTTEFKWLHGSPVESLSEPFSVVLDIDLAEKYFGEKDPVGQFMVVMDREYKVTGVFTGIPPNTDHPFKMLFSFSTIELMYPEFTNDWGSLGNFLCYVVIDDPSQKATVEQKIQNVYARHATQEQAENRLFRLQELRDIHHDTRFENLNNRVVSFATLLTLGCIGLFLLILACANYANLSLAQSRYRTREFGIRKTLGGSRWDVMIHFFGESLALTFFSAVFALLFSLLSIRHFSNLVGIPLNQPLPLDLFTFLGLFLLVIVVSLICSGYPYLLISASQPVDLMRKKFGFSPRGVLVFTKSMVVVQFIISLVMIVGTITVYRQYNFMTNSDIGFDKDAVFTVPVPNNESTLLERFKSVLLLNPAIRNVSYSNVSPAVSANWTRVSRFTDDEGMAYAETNIVFIDTSYIETYGLKLVAGNNINPGDSASNILINEELAKQLNFMTPEVAIGNYVNIYNNPNMIISGVLKDYHYDNFYNKIRPTVLIYTMDQGLRTAGIKLVNIEQDRNSYLRNMRNTLAFTEDSWRSVFGEAYYEYEFLDDRIRGYYEEEENSLNLIGVFALITVMIACLGISGLALYSSEQRAKEIGIRKVNGAKIWEVVAMLNMDFVRCVLIAFIIATPVAWHVMDKWLENFAYKAGLGWWIFALAGILALGIALLTVSWQSWRAAGKNPVEALRYE